MTGDPLHMVEIAALLRELTARLIASQDLDEAVGDMARTAARTVPPPAWCGITLIRAGAPTTAATSPGMPTELDEVQYAQGDGPCLAAIRGRELIVVDDLATDDRWPAWRDRALAAGVAGVLAAPLDVDDHVVGALNLYTGAPERLGADVQLAALLVSEHAGLLLTAVLDRSRLASTTASLTAALGSGEQVNRAIGIVMAQRGCGAEDALQVLQQASANLHIPLQDVADRLVSTIASRAPVSVPLS